MNATTQQSYRVLARKYRPETFSELIGQDALVRTLSNALTLGRLAHAFVLTGVRGIGKTSTARLLAKGLNCVGVDGNGGPTLEPCGHCEPCQAITGGRHVDVLEIFVSNAFGIILSELFFGSFEHRSTRMLMKDFKPHLFVYLFIFLFLDCLGF